MEEKQKIRIGFVYYSNSSFVENDYEILSKHFVVNRVEYKRVWDAFKIAKVIFRSDMSFSWFADGWAFLAVLFSKIFRKKSLVVVGGYDVACEPQINYGLYAKNKARQWIGKYTLNNADILLPVSEYTKTECLEHLSYPRDLHTIYLGIDTEKFKPSGDKENNLVITVGRVDWSNLKRKGIETFVESAKLISEVHFVVIGKWIDDSVNYLRSIATSNVEFTNFVSEKELIRWYQKARVYVQASLHEGFGCSVAEAMLCECIPVVTEKGALPELAGNSGFYIHYGKAEMTAEVIKKALKSDKGKEAREEIKKNFTIEKREGEIKKLIEEVIKQQDESLHYNPKVSPEQKRWRGN